MTAIHIAYLDRLSCSSLSSVIFSGRKYSHIFYFNVSPGAWEGVKLCQWLGLLKATPRPVEFTLDDIRDENGSCQFFRIGEDVKNICMEMGSKEFSKSFFLKGFAGLFPIDRLVLYFEKVAEERIYPEAVFINAARWHADNRLNARDRSADYFLEKGLFGRYLAPYATGMGMRTVEYRSIVSSSHQGLLKKVGAVFSSKKKAAPANPSALKVKREEFTPRRFDASAIKAPVVGAWYTCRTVTFNLKDRSDFFWMLKSDLPRDRVLVYFDRTDIPATREMSDTINREGLNTVALSNGAATTPDVPVWQPGACYSEMKRAYGVVLMRKYLMSLARLAPPPLFYAAYMLNFTKQYSYWFDFFKTTGIKVNVAPPSFFKTYVPKNLALENAGGVSVSYQWSVINQSSVSMSLSTDVMFSFGPEFKRIWEENGSHALSLVYCGYITDYAFKEVRQDALALREGLKSKGVKFIVCFFDENSANDRMSAISNEKTALTYGYFLTRLLEDETLGVIFKPGYPKSLLDRLSSINPLIEKAKATGRCVFLDKGTYLTQTYPALAAQAADVCIGLLLSGTVSLEAWLSGTPTVFLDLEKLYSNPIYQWGKGKVVFEEMDSLFSALRQYRENPDGCPGFGDLSRWAKDKDPFKDGKASLRMGQYIGWLLEAFDGGMTRQGAIPYADGKYARVWGEGNIARLRGVR